MNNREVITMPAPQPTTAPEPTTKPAGPDTAPSTRPDKGNDPWKVPAPSVQPGPKA